MLLRYQQGFSEAELAAICGEPPATLTKRVARAMCVLSASVATRATP